jgi:predicted MFS family arabinose efflux permease
VGGYIAAFLLLAGVAMIAVTVVYSKMPEVKDIQKTRTAVEGSR